LAVGVEGSQGVADARLIRGWTLMSVAQYDPNPEKARKMWEVAGQDLKAVWDATKGRLDPTAEAALAVGLGRTEIKNGDPELAKASLARLRAGQFDDERVRTTAQKLLASIAPSSSP
jgi:hypothetical protein